MSLAFIKMHGLGNDYVYIETFSQRVNDAARLARAVSDRHRGVGGDGLILVAPPDVPGADVRMIMYNADGSRAQMCGNGIRCVAKFAYERALARRNPMFVQTDRGVLRLELHVLADGKVETVRVNMGEPLLEAARIPTRLPGPRVVEHPLELGERSLRVTCVSMGNPHAVIYVERVEDVPLREWGPQIESHAAFPDRINVHFVRVQRPDFVEMITWERGTGPTQACGTGASAVCVAGVLTGRSDRRITARLPGGELLLEWDESSGHVFKSGPATEVFQGSWPTE